MGNPRLKKKRRAAGVGRLNITSMMDMMTIILFFLLKSYSVSEAVLTPPKDVTLPESTSRLDAQKAEVLVVSRDSLMLDSTGGNASVVPLKDGLVSPAQKKGLLIPQLYKELRARAELSQFITEHSARSTFEGKIILHMDKDVPFATLREVMFTAGQADFQEFNFTVLGPSD